MKNVNKENLVIIGCGGHSLSILSSIVNSNQYHILGYTDLIDKGEIMGVSYLGKEDTLDSKVSPNLIMGISYLKNPADRKLRFDLTRKFEDAGFHFPNIISQRAIVSDNAGFTKGAVILNGAIVNTFSKIKDHAVINTGAIVEHGCVIGNQFFLGPNAVVCGDVKIGDNVFIGALSVIRDGITICDNVVIGMGAVVTKDITQPGIYAGHPAKRLVK